MKGEGLISDGGAVIVGTICSEWQSAIRFDVNYTFY